MDVEQSAPAEQAAPASPAATGPQPGDIVRRHRLSTRLWHWNNALALLVLLMSGLMIFNAHPRLYWGQYGANPDHAWLEIGAKGAARDTGYLRIGAVSVETTGVLGVWQNREGATVRKAFPWWATIPSGYDLVSARLWHFFFAWMLAVPLALYMLWSLFNGHVRRDLHIRRAEWSPRHILHDIADHARLRFPTGAAALDYNILQKFSYIGVIFILLPLVIGTGLTMSPMLDAGMPWLLDLFGGRASARSLHFIAAFALFGFFLVHMLMVVLAGPVNEVRSMLTGWYRLPGKRATEPAQPSPAADMTEDAA